MKRTFTLLALGIAVACGSSAGDVLDEMPAPGDIMDDVIDGVMDVPGDIVGDVFDGGMPAPGDIMDDVIDGVMDVPSADAQDATGHPVDCNKERVNTRVDISRTGEETLRMVTTTRFAEVEVPDFKSVGIERCDPLSDNNLWQCQPSTEGTQYTCEGLVAKPCTFYWGAGTHRGNTVIVDCTTERQIIYAQNPESNSTTRCGHESVSLFY